MKTRVSYFILLTALSVLVSGCATAKPRRAPETDANNQVAQLQNEIQAKDQQIQDLQYQVESNQQAIKTNFSGSRHADKKSIIRVHGVSPLDLQKALVRAGYNPGPLDGSVGRKTKNAVRKFQRKHDLPADGYVGEKTWAYLKS